MTCVSLIRDSRGSAVAVTAGSSRTRRRPHRGYSMTSSARESTDGGSVRPRALAVLSRVEDWRGTLRPVSSPRRFKPGVPISGTGLSWSLRVMGYETYRPGALSGTHQVPHSVICEQPERGVEPCRTPPLPAKAPTIPRPHQMASDSPLDPQPHEGEAPARVPNPEVVRSEEHTSELQSRP